MFTVSAKGCGDDEVDVPDVVEYPTILFTDLTHYADGKCWEIRKVACKKINEGRTVYIAGKDHLIGAGNL
jgi:hypothetical protein